MKYIIIISAAALFCGCSIKTNPPDMPSGIHIINDTGSIQIDENYANLHLRQKGSATFSGSVPYSVATIVVNAQTPVLAWNSSKFVVLMSAVRSGSQWTFTLGSDSSGGALDWYLFDRLDTTQTGSGFGIQTFDAGGQILFDSRQPVMRVSGTIQHEGMAPAQPMQFMFPSGRTYAICQSYSSMVAAPGGGYNIVIYSSATRVSGSAVDLQMIVLGVMQGYIDYFDNFNRERKAYSAIVIDVTDM